MPLYLSATGLTTSLVPHGKEGFQLALECERPQGPDWWRTRESRRK